MELAHGATATSGGHGGAGITGSIAAVWCCRFSTTTSCISRRSEAAAIDVVLRVVDRVPLCFIGSRDRDSSRCLRLSGRRTRCAVSRSCLSAAVNASLVPDEAFSAPTRLGQRRRPVGWEATRFPSSGKPGPWLFSHREVSVGAAPASLGKPRQTVPTETGDLLLCSRALRGPRVCCWVQAEHGSRTAVQEKCARSAASYRQRCCQVGPVRPQPRVQLLDADPRSAWDSQTRLTGAAELQACNVTCVTCAALGFLRPAPRSTVTP